MTRKTSFTPQLGIRKKKQIQIQACCIRCLFFTVFFCDYKVQNVLCFFRIGLENSSVFHMLSTSQIWSVIIISECCRATLIEVLSCLVLPVSAAVIIFKSSFVGHMNHQEGTNPSHICPFFITFLRNNECICASEVLRLCFNIH